MFKNIFISTYFLVVLILAQSVQVSAIVTDDDDNSKLTVSRHVVASQTSDVEFENNLYFLRKCHLLVVEKIVSYLDEETIDALYNAEVIPDSSADYKRNFIRKRLKPLIIKKIEDRVIDIIMPSSEDNASKLAMRAEVKNFLQSEIRLRKAEGELVNVGDLWMSREVEDYFRAKKYIDTIAVGFPCIFLDNFKKLRRFPPCEHIKETLSGVFIKHMPFPSGLENISKITNLSIADSPMTSVKGFYKFRHLETLYITRTPLASLEGLSDTPIVDRIARIRWSPQNQVSYIVYRPDDLISRIMYINLDKTAITSLKGLERLVNVQSLQITNSPLDSIEGIELMSEIKSIHFSGLQLKSLRGLEKLRKLRSSYLYDLPNAKDKAEVLRELVMKGCEVTPDMSGLPQSPLNDWFI